MQVIETKSPSILKTGNLSSSSMAAKSLFLNILRVNSLDPILCGRIPRSPSLNSIECKILPGHAHKKIDQMSRRNPATMELLSIACIPNHIERSTHPSTVKG